MATMTAGRPRNLPPTSEVDVRQIIHEAHSRWLRPVEVCEILRNYRLHNFKLNPVPPTQPQSGSLFLFDRKALRYFRKDGHNWRKKKDGKTVREAHERLKAGSVDVLHCYYAHGEDNVNFQRRCYWMLDPSYEHIVLVHYREVTENNRSCIIRNMHDYSSAVNSVFHPQLASQHQHVSPTVSGLTTTSLPSSVASPETVEAMGATLSPELDEVESETHDEFDDPGIDIEGGLQPDQSAVQLSLQQQLGDQQFAGAHALPSSSQWPGLAGNARGGMDGQFSPLFSPQDTDFKPAFTELQQQHSQRIDSEPQDVRNSLLGNFSRGGDIGSISRRFAEMLDSPGPYGNSTQRSSSLNPPLDLAALTALMNNGSRAGTGNGTAGYVKAEVNSPWAEMLAQVTTPSTRRTLLENHGLLPGLGQAPQGKETAAVLGAPLSPKGIVDALSPRNLGRVPQTPLEANLRAVTEKEVLKEAEEKVQAQRNRWQTTQAESSSVDAVIHRTQDLSGARQMSGSQFIEPDTLERLVVSGHSHQDSYSPTGVRDKGAWIQQATQQNEQPVLSFPSVNSFDQQSTQRNQERVQQEKLQPVVPPSQSNGFSFVDNGVDNVGMLSPTVEHYNKDQPEEVAHHDVMEGYKKLDSFGRWMNSEIVTDSLAPYLSGGSSGWDSVQLDGLSQMQMDGGLSSSPSISEQCFNISDFSPECGSTTEETKVLITGTFVGSINPSDHTWACMFGENEVPAELIDGNALRCRAPKHEAGKVNFYITRNDRYPCSQVREFEYRSVGQSTYSSSESANELLSENDLLYQVRFARMLFATTSNNSRIGTRTQTFKESEDDEWRKLENMLHAKKPLAEVKEQLMQLMLKKRLREWLQVKSKEEGSGASVYDDHGQGVSHFAAALGYVWSIDPLLKANIPINFRDEEGLTALHWAAHFGREEVVCALLKAGASPNCVTDCNKQYPQGLTAADLAAMQGYNGLAAFLSEKSLTVTLSRLNLDDGIEVDENAALIAGEKAVAQLARRSSIRSSVQVEKDQIVLQTSLEAVRFSTQAAAKIRDVFRQLSFRRRQQQSFTADDEVDEYGLSASEVRSMLAAQKIQKAYRGHQKNKKLHLAATAIQRKFRGWKGRKDFQTFRQRIIKIQAHVRGRLVRKQFRKILWSVSILEKLVLRWRRRRKGLRGFRSESDDFQSSLNSDDDDDLMREGRHRNHAAVEKDVRRVEQMTREKAAREQYNRLHERISKGELAYNDHGPGSREYLLNQDLVMSTVE